jgi:hypothetical protein
LHQLNESEVDMNQDLQQLLMREQALQDQLNVWNKEMADLKKEIALLSCPYKVGDMVQHVKTWGRTSGEKEVFIIDLIGPTGGPHLSGARYYLRGRKLKKDGKPGATVMAIHANHQPYVQPGETK